MYMYIYMYMRSTVFHAVVARNEAVAVAFHCAELWLFEELGSLVELRVIALGAGALLGQRWCRAAGARL